MNPETESQTLGEQLAQEAVEHVLEHAEKYCERERERITAANEPKIIAIENELATLNEAEAALKDRIRQAPPIGDIQTRRRKARYYWAITAMLAIAGFFFSLLAFDPYRLGWKSYLYCLGIAIVTPFCVEKFLETWSSARLMKALATVACASALAALVLLAVVRGDVIGEQLKAVSAVVFSDGAPVSQPQTDFYDKTLLLLRCVMGLLAIAMEIGAGVALYEARRLASEGEDPIQLSDELKALREKIASRHSELAGLRKEPSLFANRFWRDFHRGMLNGVSRRAAAKAAALLFLALALFSPARSLAADRTNLVVALDMSQSVAVRGTDGKEEFQKNVAAVSHLLGETPSNSRVTVIGITDRSFAQPEIILSAQLPDDEGYFKEKLAAGRTQLLHAWHERSKALEASSPHTDVLGAMLVAGEIFRQSQKGRNVLVIFSDMREESAMLNLERPALVPVASALAAVQKQKLVPDLKGVEVYALGVDGAGKETPYWQSLRDFWTAYFEKSGASLKAYSILRDPPKLGE